MTWYKITIRMDRTITGAKKYKPNKFIKGKTYTIKRKLTPKRLKEGTKNSKSWGCKVLKVEKL